MIFEILASIFVYLMVWGPVFLLGFIIGDTRREKIETKRLGDVLDKTEEIVKHFRQCMKLNKKYYNRMRHLEEKYGDYEDDYSTTEQA